MIPFLQKRKSMENKLKYVLAATGDFEINGKMTDDFKLFIQKLKAQKIKVDFCTKNQIKEWLKKEKINASQVVAIAATDEFLEAANQFGMTVLAYFNPQIKGQTYKKAMILVEGFEELDANFMERMYLRKHHIPWKIIETKRTYIREITLDDLPALFQMYGHKGITDYIEPLKKVEEEKEYTKAYIEHQYWFYGYGMWVVFQKENNQLIGRAGLENREVEKESLLEMGYAIDTDYQRQGYALEVCLAIIEYAKECLEFETLNCFVEEKNIASIALLEKLLFEKANEVLMDGKKMLRFQKSLVK